TRDGNPESELADPPHSGPYHEVHLPGRFPDPRAADEAKRRGEARVNAVDRNEIVEQVVRVVGGEPPREGGPRDSRRLAAGNPELGLKVRPVEDEGEVDVHAARPLHTLPTASRVARSGRADGGWRE